MIPYNLKTAFRFLYKNKVFAGINAVGLSIALTVSFIILLYVINEYSYDRYHKNGKRIYRVLNYYEDFKTTEARTPYILASTLKEEFPQVEKAINLNYADLSKLKVKDEFINIRRVQATDSEIFDVFSLPLVMGSSNKHLLDNLNSIVLSRELAEKVFPGENPIGKEITGIIGGKEHSFIITGVFENIPVNSTLRAECFVNSKWSLDWTNNIFGSANADVDWTNNSWTTWVLLSQGSEGNSLEQQFRSLETKYIGENPKYHYSLQKLSDVYLRSEHVQNKGISGNLKKVRLFSFIAFLIVLVAGGNYIILSTAVSSVRSREIGIRKTYGGGKSNIRNQMLSESVLLVISVLPVALFLTRIALPYAEKLFQKDIPIIGGNVITYISVYAALTILIGISSGLYISAYLSRLKTLDILKNLNYTGRRRVLMRSSLIVIQLVIFCSFVACTLIIRSQYLYALTSDTGHYKQNIIQIDLDFNNTGYSAFINSIRTNPNIVQASGTTFGLPAISSMSFPYPSFENKEVMVKIEGLNVDYGFLETMGIEVIQGRDFSEEFGSDLTKAVILNQTAVKQLGLKDPVGTMLDEKTIIGVVKDFNLHSIHTDIPALSIGMTDKYINAVVVRYKPGTLDDVLPALDAEWKKIAGDRPFEYITIEDMFKHVYESEKILATIVTLASVFTILISIIGLFGLTLFIATTRTKEIGIKKVLGSSEWSILYSLLYENVILVLIATILSVPVTIYFMTKWLNNYPYRINIEWWVFLTGFAVAGLVVMLTVYFHSWKVARTNPVEALRYE